MSPSLSHVIDSILDDIDEDRDDDSCPTRNPKRSNILLDPESQNNNNNINNNNINKRQKRDNRQDDNLNDNILKSDFNSSPQISDTSIFDNQSDHKINNKINNINNNINFNKILQDPILTSEDDLMKRAVELSVQEDRRRQEEEEEEKRMIQLALEMSLQESSRHSPTENNNSIKRKKKIFNFLNRPTSSLIVESPKSSSSDPLLISSKITSDSEKEIDDDDFDEDRILAEAEVAAEEAEEKLKRDLDIQMVQVAEERKRKWMMTRNGISSSQTHGIDQTCTSPKTVQEDAWSILAARIDAVGGKTETKSEVRIKTKVEAGVKVETETDSVKENVSVVSVNFNPSNLFENEELSCSIHELFLQYNTRFFSGSLGSVEVKWSNRMTRCAGLCRFDRLRGCSISLSCPLLKFRPIRDLHETLLHEMIHAHLFLSNRRDASRDGHGPLFQSFMRMINQETGLNITIYHNFNDEVSHYQTHIWQCTGPCRLRPPHFGIVKRSMNRPPGPSDTWYLRHKNSCDGVWVKLAGPPPKDANSGQSRTPQSGSPKNLVNKSAKSVKGQSGSVQDDGRQTKLPFIRQSK